VRRKGFEGTIEKTKGGGGKEREVQLSYSKREDWGEKVMMHDRRWAATGKNHLCTLFILLC